MNRPGGRIHPAGRRPRVAAVVGGMLAASVLAGGAVVFALTAAASTVSRPAPLDALPPAPTEVALVVDGTDVPFHAISTFLARERSTVVAEAQTSGADVQAPDFWNRPSDGSTPAQTLVDRARDDSVRLQVQLHLASKAGIAAPRDYGQLLDAWTAENARRAAAIREGQPVYGPPSMTETDFVDYFLGELRQQTSEALATAGRIDGSPAGAQAYAAQHPEGAPAAPAAARTRFLEAQYDQLVDDAVRVAVVTSTPALEGLPSLPCVARGSC